jgi:hypothetical protein
MMAAPLQKLIELKADDPYCYLYPDRQRGIKHMKK